MRIIQTPRGELRRCFSMLLVSLCKNSSLNVKQLPLSDAIASTAILKIHITQEG